MGSTPFFGMHPAGEAGPRAVIPFRRAGGGF